MEIQVTTPTGKKFLDHTEFSNNRREQLLVSSMWPAADAPLAPASNPIPTASANPAIFATTVHMLCGF